MPEVQSRTCANPRRLPRRNHYQEGPGFLFVATQGGRPRDTGLTSLHDRDRGPAALGAGSIHDDRRPSGSAGRRGEVVAGDDVREPVGPGEGLPVASGELGDLGHDGHSRIRDVGELAEQALESGR